MKIEMANWLRKKCENAGHTARVEKTGKFRGYVVVTIDGEEFDVDESTITRALEGMEKAHYDRTRRYQWNEAMAAI